MKQKEQSKPQKVGLTADNKYELPDPKPLAIPVGFHRPPSLSDTVSRLVRSALLAREAAEAGAETPEEADDFDLEDVDPRGSAEIESDFDRLAPPGAPPTDSMEDPEPPKRVGKAPARTDKKKPSPDAIRRAGKAPVESLETDLEDEEAE